MTVRGKDEIIDLCSGRGGGLFGVAFDVGTTTVVCFLMDLMTGEKRSVKASMNPQVAFGDDVITRISFCQENPDGLEKLRSSIPNGVAQMGSGQANLLELNDMQWK